MKKELMIKEQTIKYTKAEKLKNFGIPTYCSQCNKMIEPKLHLRIFRDGFFSITRFAKAYTDECEWCNHEFEYWA